MDSLSTISSAKPSSKPSTNSSTKSVPVNAHLEHLRKQAKDLLKECRAQRSEALQRVRAQHPRAAASFTQSGAQPITLADAQLVVAREYGFASWPKMTAHLAVNTRKSQIETEAAELKRALKNLREGKLCILFDDEGRENEGDFVLAAEHASPDAVNFIIKNGRGTLCLAMSEAQAAKLQLWPINRERTELSEPAFLNSIDAVSGVTTGVSAADRAHTIRTAVRDDVQPTDLKSPGHVFPLRAVSGGLMARKGHTEGSVALMELAGLKPAAVICEILNDDGTMARWPELERIAREHDLPILKISDLLD